MTTKIKNFLQINLAVQAGNVRKALKIATRFLMLSVIFSFFFIADFSIGGMARAEAANITISGTINNAGSGLSVKIAVGTSSPSIHEAVTNGSGEWAVTDIDDAHLSVSTPFVVWLDDESDSGTTLMAGFSGGNITSVPLLYNHVVAHAVDSDSVVIMSDFTFYDNSDDADILYVSTGASFVINTNFLIHQGTFLAPSHLTISGNFVNHGDFDHNDGTIYMDNTRDDVIRYLAGRDGTGTSNGNGIFTEISSFAIKGNYLYVGGVGDFTACSQTAPAPGCELKVYDISSSTNPTYVAGRDSNGTANGATQGYFFRSLVIHGNYLYAGRNGNSTACSQTAPAPGCELMVFDISNPTNPVYVAGRDGNGSSNGNTFNEISGMSIYGNYLYVTRGGSDSTACSQTTPAVGCELMVFNITTPTNPVYVAGRDSNGTANGATQGYFFRSLVIHGNYLYAGRNGNSTACSQTAPAPGCELMVFDISNPTNPVYVAGRDGDGSATGSGTVQVSSLTTYGNYLYVGKDGEATPCSQTPGSAAGCELMVFDISSSTNPIYVAGRDGDGSATGSGTVQVSSLTTYGNYLYATKFGNATPCSQTTPALGCELMVFDITTPTNPVYVAGMDGDGSKDGAGASFVSTIIIVDYNIYIGKNGNATPCSQTPGSAIGCELMIFDAVPVGLLYGNLVADSSLNNVEASGGTVGFRNNASTTNITTAPSATLTAPSHLTISGNFMNHGDFDHNDGTIYMDNTRDDVIRYLAGRDSSGSSGGVDGLTGVLSFASNGNYLYVGRSGNSAVCSQAAGSASGCELMVFDISSSTNPLYVAGRDANGTSNGNGSISINSIVIHNNHLYIGKNGNTTPCSQTTPALGCELMVFDISSSTNPIYVAGRDKDGSGSGVVGFFNIQSLAVVNNHLYVGKGTANVTPCSQTAGSAQGCALQIYDISNPANPLYVAGRDANGSADGTSIGHVVYFLAIHGNYLYAGKSSNNTPCSQTAGSAQGCELQIFDISSSTNPTYVAGRDADGTSNGNSFININSLAFYNNHLYAGKGTVDATPCSQTTPAPGCELMVFDISSSTNPIYVAGRDGDGSSSGNSGVQFTYLTTHDNYLYVTKFGNATPCSQTTPALGCELMVFDISSSTNPIYVAGRDADGSSNGNSALGVSSIFTNDEYVYIGKVGNATACSQTTPALGCELMIFDAVPVGLLYGNLVADSSLNNVEVAGGAVLFLSNASTTNIAIDSGSNLSAPSFLTVAGDMSNDGTFKAGTGQMIMTGANKTLSGNLTDTSSLYDLTISGSVTIDETAASTTNLTIAGGGSLVAPNYLTVNGNFVNQGEFDNNDGTVYLEAELKDIIHYLAGRDPDGTVNGNNAAPVNAIAVANGYMYIGKSGSATACSQTAPALGCEIQVYDISDPNNPTYVAGRDVDGSSNGIGNIAINKLVIKDNYLYVGKNTSISTAPCSQVIGEAIGCELMVFDISSSTNPTYVAGRDADGTSNGSNSLVGISAFVIRGSYLYVSKSGNATPCSQTTPALGCELQIFDISSSTNPIYVAGRDGDGSNNGNTTTSINGLFIKDSYLYVGKFGNVTPCTQATPAPGCELMVFDISSSTNPIYVAGRDADGSSNGIINTTIQYLDFHNNYLYVGKGGNNATPCSQTAGSAQGCELMVFDISSSTNPTYVAGRDADGSSGGNGATSIFSMAFVDEYIYVGKGGETTPCSQTTPAVGCELMVFGIYSHTASGLLTDTSAFNALGIKGRVNIVDNADTTDLNISANSTLIAPPYLTIEGNMSNYGNLEAALGTIELTGLNQSLISPATTTFYSLTKNVEAASTLTFTAGGTYVVNNTLTLNGAENNLLSLRSSSSTGEWNLDPQATVDVSYLDVQDSNNINVTTIICDIGCIDSENNTNWFFGGNDIDIYFSSSENYHFYVGQATTTLGEITISESEDAAGITALNDVRITISTTTTDFRFDDSVTTLVFGGSAAGKVSGTISYEDEVSTLVIDVIEDFAASDVLTINGIVVGDFAAISIAAGNFSLHVEGDIEGEPAAVDDKSIHITGSLIVGNHPSGQVGNKFSYQNRTDETLFAFSLEPSNENATITDMVITLSGVQMLTENNVTAWRLYKDVNDDRQLDDEDELLAGEGIMTINGQHGAVTFSADFVVADSGSYIVVANTSGIPRDGMMMVDLPAAGMTTLGEISNQPLVLLGAVNKIQHIRSFAGGGGGSARVGNPPPPGNSVETGGAESGGGEVGQEVDGENIALDNNYFKPTATGDIHDEWTNGVNALNSDGTHATAATVGLRQSFNGFNFGIAPGNAIKGIAVKLDASGTTADGTIDVSLSWDGGNSYTTGKATPTLSDSDIVYVVGGGNDTWGRSWSASEFNPTNFRVRVTATPSENTIRLDALEIRVFHQASGGGSGGGGGI